MSDKEKSGGLHTAYRKKTYIGAEALKGASEQLLRRAKSIARSEVANAAAKTYELVLTAMPTEDSGDMLYQAAGSLVESISQVKPGDVVTTILMGGLVSHTYGKTIIDFVDWRVDMAGREDWFAGFRLNASQLGQAPAFVLVRYSSTEGTATATISDWRELYGVIGAVPETYRVFFEVTKTDATGIAGVLSAGVYSPGSGVLSTDTRAQIGGGVSDQLKVGDIVFITRVTGEDTSAAKKLSGKFVITEHTGIANSEGTYGFRSTTTGECYNVSLIPLGNDEWAVKFAYPTDAGMPVVDQTATEVAIKPGVLNRWGEVESLTVTFAAGSAGRAGEYCMEFVSGATATTLSLPAGVKFPEDPVIEANMRYQISVVNNVGLIVGVEI